MLNIAPSDRPSLKDFARLHYDRVGGAWVLLYPEGALKLNPTALAIVELCKGELTVAQISEKLAEEFNAAKSQIDKDIVAAIDRLYSLNLIEFKTEDKDFRHAGSGSVAAVLLLLVAFCVAGCSSGKPAAPVDKPASDNGARAQTKLVASRDEKKSEDDDGQWPMAAKNHANTRYSGLKEITTENAKSLKLAWTYSMGPGHGQEAAPIVVNDTMYIVAPFPNILHALDLKNNGSLKWAYDPKPQMAAQGVACCDVVNRGCVYANGRIFYNTLDCHTVAVDAETGKEIWKTKLGDINRGETITMSPLVVKDKVLVGNSGGEMGVRGWLTALNVSDGSVAWRAYNTGPDADCLIGDKFKPFYEMDRGKDLGVTTWPPEHWKIGGGTVWGWVSYDPELNLVYYGTGNPGPWNPDARPGDNKWTCGVFARDPETGQAHWYYQWSPHDLFDHDGINECILVDLEIDGRNRKTLLHAGRTGYVYVLDRGTGEVISATPFVRITSSKGVDLKSGRLISDPSKEPQLGKAVRDVAPFAAGAKDWEPCAWSPQTRMLYIPATNMAMDYESVEANYIAGTPYVGANVKMYAGLGGNRGEFMAWDPVKKQKIWSIKEFFPCWSGALATAGDVVFYGTMDGWFKAVHARTGEELWKFKTESGIIAQPVSYRGPDGKQYVAILSGVGGWSGAIVSNELDPRDPNAALGFVNGMADLPDHTKKGGTLYVFALPQ